jgi:hypothetical protein
VQQHHQGAGARFDAVQAQPMDVDPPVGHAPGASVWVIPSLLSRATRDSNEEPSAVNCSRQYFLLQLPIVHQELSTSFDSW